MALAALTGALMDQASPGTYRLTRYFVAIGLLVAAVVGVGLSCLSAREVRDDLKEESQDHAVSIARHLNRQVQQRFVAPLLARGGAVDLDRPEQLAELDALVRQSIAELHVRDVYLYDADGRVIYSTRADRRGTLVHDNPNYARARDGKVATVLVDRGRHLDMGGEGPVTLLETYVPAALLAADGSPTAQQLGVIEVYQDATELQRDMRRATRRMIGISTLGIVCLMVGLAVVIRSADRTIDERSRALLQANARLAELSDDLERQVEDRTQRLVRAETLASLGTLAAGVAHEVNNPVAAIASCAEGLLRRCGPGSPLRRDAAFGEFPEYLQIIRDEAFRVKEVTRNLLDFSRTGHTGVRGVVDVGLLVRSVARLVDHRAEHEGKRVLVEVERPEAITVLGDEAALRQLVLNVTFNALDATQRGGTIRWRVRREGGGAELVCEDDGRGMTEEELARACEPFFTRKAVGKGTGLGLFIAYGVAQRHGGTLELSSEGLGRGTKVTVHLPPSSSEDESP